MAGYDPAEVLRSVDHHTVAVMAPMAVCIGATFAYLVMAFRTAKAHQAYPAPFIAVGLFAVHDAGYVLDWNRWFEHYDHWFPELWAVALGVTTFIELALVFQVYRYGRGELMPQLSQRMFGAALIGGLVLLAVFWSVIKHAINDDLYLISFAITAWMGPAFSLILATGRQSRRGQTMPMAWALVFINLGMFTAWLPLDPYFRSARWLLFFAAAMATALFNVWSLSRYPSLTTEAAADRPTRQPVSSVDESDPAPHRTAVASAIRSARAACLVKDD